MRRIIGLLLVCGVTQGVYAAADDASKQMQMMNSQIQSQLQQMQENQKKVDKTLNDTIQAQLKKLQSDLQKQTTDSFNKTQAQIKAVQDAMQLQIKQVNDSLNKLSAGAATSGKK